MKLSYRSLATPAVLFALVLGFGLATGTGGPSKAFAEGKGKYDTSGRTYRATCTKTKQTRVVVGATAQACPATALASRNEVVICSSIEAVANTDGGQPRLKIRTDGTDPAFGIGAPGWLLTPGNCTPPFYLMVDAGPGCISEDASMPDGGGALADIYECAP